MPAIYLTYKSLWQGLDWVFPPYCAGCETKGVRWCAQCRAACRRVGAVVCGLCGRPMARAGLCAGCQARRPAYGAARSWGLHEGALRQAVHRLKYRRDLGLGEALAVELKALLQEQAWEVDLVLPLPLAAKRQKERGYNQSVLLALPLALSVGVPYSRRTLLRTRETLSQVGLSQRERWENVAGAFEARPEKVRGRTVLLVDDVMTTGATLNAAAEALCRAGAAQVYAITLSRASELTAA